jgi:hypothetical protein
MLKLCFPRHIVACAARLHFVSTQAMSSSFYVVGRTSNGSGALSEFLGVMHASSRLRHDTHARTQTNFRRAWDGAGKVCIVAHRSVWPCSAAACSHSLLQYLYCSREGGRFRIVT